MNNSIKIFVLAAGLFSLSSCEKFLDVNDNPNSPVTENLALSAKLPGALMSTVNQETKLINPLGSLWAGYWGTTSEATTQFTNEKTYNGVGIRGTRDGIQIWEGSYNTLLYYQLIKVQAQQEGSLFYGGIAKIMQGRHFIQLVDLYNNVPFEEAMQGTQYISPAYENGKTVYEKSINMITEGINDIKSAAATDVPGNDDIVFAGNKLLWAKFGNTLKLRALIHQSALKDNAAYITAEIQKITQEGSGFLGVNENAYINPGYLNTAGKMNPYWETYYRNAGGQTTAHISLRPTVYILEKYKAFNDPRMAKIYVNVGTEYKGVLFGNPIVDEQYNAVGTSAFRGPVENGNQPAGLFKNFNQASILLSSFESLFLQAEAAHNGWINGTAKTFYDQGIAESFKYVGLTLADAQSYASQSAVNLSMSTNIDEQIITQKWLALNSISGLEAWNDYRRTGYPAIPNSLLAPVPSARPLRLMYPESERQTNSGQTDQQGNDEVTVGKIWWDTN